VWIPYIKETMMTMMMMMMMINQLTSSIENEEIEELKKIPMDGQFYWDLGKPSVDKKKIPGMVM
jgi:hypothetical protein